MKSSAVETTRRRNKKKTKLNATTLWQRVAQLDRSQNSVAREIGITPGYLSMLVNGQRSPSVSVRRRMQKVLGVSFDNLFVKDTVRVESMRRSVSGDLDEA